MFHRGIFTTLILFLTGAMLLGSAHAASFPITATSGRTTVTGAYRPLDFDMNLVSGTGLLNIDVLAPTLSFTGTFRGTFTGVGYATPEPTGASGDWQMNLFLTTLNFGYVLGASDLLITANSPGTLIGSITNTVTSPDFAALPAIDRPEVTDRFDLFTTSSGNLMHFSQVGFGCLILQANCDGFTLEFLQDVQHLGPYNSSPSDPNIDRVNERCSINENRPCGGVTLTASSIPEPSSVLLVGIGMLGLALGRRRKA